MVIISNFSHGYLSGNFDKNVLLGNALYKWRHLSTTGKQILGLGTTKLSNDRPGTMRGRGRPLNSKDKKEEKRSVTVPKYKEKNDKLKAVILDFAANKEYYSYQDIADELSNNHDYPITANAVRMAVRIVFKNNFDI